MGRMHRAARKHRGAAVLPVAFAAFAAAVATAPRARACGVSTADGLSACSLAEHEEATRRRWRLGASGSYTSTTYRLRRLSQPGDARVGDRVARLPAHPALDVAARRGEHRRRPPGHAGGAVQLLGGPDRGDRRLLARGLRNEAVRHPDLEPVVLGGEDRDVGDGPSGSLYAALDLRLGALVGTTIAGVLSPYAVGRVFGGPVYWAYQGEDVIGTDAHHYQLGAGLTVVAFGRVNVFAEGVPIGERSFAAGTAFAF